MTVVFKGQTYYRTREACEMAGVSRATLLRWLRSGVLMDTMQRDGRGWRLFSKADIERIEIEVNRMNYNRLGRPFVFEKRSAMTKNNRNLIGLSNAAGEVGMECFQS